VSIHVAQGQDKTRAADIGMPWWGQRPNLPTNSVMFVAGIWPPDIQISIEAIAAVPDSAA
jgi:enamine deaminase RidA (YjgF/YER057c/UK114 family)